MGVKGVNSVGVWSDPARVSWLVGKGPMSPPTTGTVPPLPPLPTGHLKYFGFWAGSVSPGNSISEQQTFVNLTMSAIPGKSADRAIAEGMRLIFTVPDYTGAGFQAFADSIAPYIDQTAAIFLMDEPDCSAGALGQPLTTVLTALDHLIAMIKARFPNTPTMITACRSFTIESDYRLPVGLDYVALESYGPQSQWLGDLAIMKTLMNGSQKLIMMPGAVAANGFTEPVLVQAASDMFNYAAGDPAVIGIIPFDWYSGAYDCASLNIDCGGGPPTGNYSIPVIGDVSARDLPNLRSEYTQLGKALRGY
jgi:hypothetical protein